MIWFAWGIWAASGLLSHLSLRFIACMLIVHTWDVTICKRQTWQINGLCTEDLWCCWDASRLGMWSIWLRIIWVYWHMVWIHAVINRIIWCWLVTGPTLASTVPVTSQHQMFSGLWPPNFSLCNRSKVWPLDMSLTVFVQVVHWLMSICKNFVHIFGNSV